jgi:hypothetical protein
MRFFLKYAAAFGSFVAVAVAVAGPALAGPATDVVASIYAEPTSELEPSKRGLYTDPARSQLDRNDEILESGDLGCIDFSLAYDAQDYDEVEIARSLRLAETAGRDEATVVASFRNFGQQVEIEWNLKLVGRAWKIADIVSRTGGWRLSGFDCGS